MKLVLELVRLCKYGTSICIQTYIQPAWHANVPVAHPGVRIFLENHLIFYSITSESPTNLQIVLHAQAVHQAILWLVDID